MQREDVDDLKEHLLSFSEKMKFIKVTTKNFQEKSSLN